MVKIRLSRTGAKKRPTYRIVVADEDFKRDGRFLESIGTYDPKVNPVKFEVKVERLQHWVSKGAQTTDTIRTLLKSKGIAERA
jgi:small subunit ribosomal protein S16